MEQPNEATQLINSSKNLYIIPSESPEAAASALALFYTLRQQGKNVNLLLEKLPERLSFLSPSLDFVSYPKNFVISVPNTVADVSQIYYEKNGDALKIYLTLEKGHIKKDSLSFYFAETKPDAIITVGVQDYSKELAEKLNAYGFLLESPIINIDSKQENQKFGKINLVEAKPLAELILSLAENVQKEAATSLLTGLVLHTENFQNHVTAEVFETAGKLMKAGADIKDITRNLYQGDKSIHLIH